MIGFALLVSASALRPQVDALAARSGFAGEIMIARGEAPLMSEGYGTIDPHGGAPHVIGQNWRLASISKQVTAALIVREVAAGHLDLDAPVAPIVHQASLGAVTLRQLLTHHSGLANPDDTPTRTVGGMPSFYRRRAPDIRYCLSKPAKPGANFSYNNCDYLIAAMTLAGAEARENSREASGDLLPRHSLWPAGLSMAMKGEHLVPGYVHGAPEPSFVLASFGAAGGLTGTARSVWGFDRSLMDGTLLAPAALAELWKPEGNGSYQALGQWVFPGTLKGCAKPKRIVERDGEIGGVQTRNFILPDDDLVVIAFTNRSSDDFAFGEIWQGKGFAYDLLSAAACEGKA